VDQATQLIESFDRLSEKLDKALKPSNASSVIFNSGGIAPWVPTAIALFCAGLIFGAIAIGGFWAAREFARSDAEHAKFQAAQETQQAYINAMYQQQESKK